MLVTCSSSNSRRIRYNPFAIAFSSCLLPITFTVTVSEWVEQNVDANMPAAN